MYNEESSTGDKITNIIFHIPNVRLPSSRNLFVTSHFKFLQFSQQLEEKIEVENFQVGNKRKKICTECIFARALIAIQKLTERARERAFRSK